jgi:hypothetical protein
MRLRGALLCACVALACMACAGTAQATWTVKTIPPPTVETELEDVACAATTFCMAVGGATEGGGNASMTVLTSTGAEWSLQAPAGVAEAPRTRLTGVSCPRSSDCTVVGYSVVRAGNLPFAEHWNGSSWTGAELPHASATTTVYDVACPTTTFCWSVGVNNSGGTYGATWNGTSWTERTVPDPTGSGQQLRGVACLSATDCTAVGRYSEAGSVIRPLAMHWDGSAWTLLSVPSPTEITEASAYAVSCSATNACTLVGGTTDREGVLRTFAARWDGSTWSAQATIDPGTRSNRLLGVSCPSATLCVATGDAEGTKPTGIAEAWDGTSWSAQTLVDPGSTAFRMAGIACPTTTSCATVGRYTRTRLLTAVERWNGTSWSVQTSANNASGGRLNGVACVETRFCLAAGTAVDQFGYEANLGYRWASEAWLELPTAEPAESNGRARGNGVGCSSSTACMTVGDFQPAGVRYRLTLAYSWNGTSLRFNASSGAEISSQHLAGVACPTATFCSAVGDTDILGIRPFTKSWNGTAWSVGETPLPSGARAGKLAGVACPSASECKAVGEYTEAFGARLTLVETGSGRESSVQRSPNPIGATRSTLNAISCTSASFCVAVGSAESEFTSRTTLVETWNGTSWSVQTSPNPRGAIGSELSGVSCTSTTACVAVGKTTISGESAGSLTLVESWNGREWTLETAVDPAESTDIQLLGVACGSATVCMAVGRYTNRAGAETMLSEKRS